MISPRAPSCSAGCAQAKLGILWILVLAFAARYSLACSPLPDWDPPVFLDQAMAAGMVVRASLVEYAADHFSESNSAVFTVTEYYKGFGPENAEITVDGFRSGSLCGVEPSDDGFLFLCVDHNMEDGASFSINEVDIFTGYTAFQTFHVEELESVDTLVVPDQAAAELEVFGNFLAYPCLADSDLYRRIGDQKCTECKTAIEQEVAAMRQNLLQGPLRHAFEDAQGVLLDAGVEP